MKKDPKLRALIDRAVAESTRGLEEAIAPFFEQSLRELFREIEKINQKAREAKDE